MNNDKRIQAMEEIIDIFNKYKLSYNNMIGITYAVLTGVIRQAVEENPQSKQAYLIGASRALDYMIDEIDKKIGGEKIEK